MPIVGIRFTKIEGSRSDKSPKGDIKINSTPRILDVKETKVPDVKKAFSVHFEFVTRYDPELGEIKMTGDILYTADAKSKITDAWKKNKRLPQNVEIEILNHLFRHCLLKIANIAQDLQLPPPIRFPVVKPKEEASSSYIG